MTDPKRILRKFWVGIPSWECWTLVLNQKRGVKPPKMDGENNGNPYEQMDDLGVKTPIFGNTHMDIP